MLKVVCGVAASLLTVAVTAGPAVATTTPRPPTTPERNAPMNWRHLGEDVAQPPARVAARTTTAATPPRVFGLDISSHADQPTATQWSTWAKTYKFVFVKATEGDYYTNEFFSNQYTNATRAGMLRGGYHFANPESGGGAAQADYFVNHGGGWTPDGRTLPGVLDIEYNPYGPTCYGLSAAAMTAWIKAFSNRYLARTGVYPTIYTTMGWWTKCTGNTDDFAATTPFWIADPSSTIGAPRSVPAGSTTWTYWQYGSDPAKGFDECRTNHYGLDCNQFNGPMSSLVRLASSYAYTAGSHFAWANKFGHPISAERTVKAFGRVGYVQDFSNRRGQRTRAVRVGGINYTVAGTILQRLDRLGGVSGYGWPTSGMRTNKVGGVQGWVQRFKGTVASALVASKYGTFPMSGPIRASWRETQRGWPTSSIVLTKNAFGALVWQQKFRGPQGPSFARNPKNSTAVYWHSGTPK